MLLFLLDAGSGTGTSVSLTGNSCTAFVGDVSVPAGTIVNVTNPPPVSSAAFAGLLTLSLLSGGGIDTTALVGTVTVEEHNAFFVDTTGQEVTASVGTVTVQAVQNVTVTGQEVTVGLGTATVFNNGLIAVTGNVMTASVGSVFGIGVTGQSATVFVGDVIVAAKAVTSVTGDTSTVSVGDVIVPGGSTVSVTGNVATAAVGTATAGGILFVFLAGNVATVSVGTVGAFAIGGITPVLVTGNEMFISTTGSILIETSWNPVHDTPVPNNTWDTIQSDFEAPGPVPGPIEEISGTFQSDVDPLSGVWSGSFGSFTLTFN